VRRSPTSKAKYTIDVRSATSSSVCQEASTGLKYEA